MVPGIEEENITTSKPEDKMPVHVIPDEREKVSPNKNLDKSSEFMHSKKYANTDTSYYDRVLAALKNLDTSYNPTTAKVHKLVIEGKYKVMGETIVVLIVEHKYDKISWVLSMSSSLDSGEFETLK